ncbi:MAG: glycoside hydrolase family 2 TIM barrel-domain containing protein, partial [Planctomycetota bacterium]
NLLIAAAALVLLAVSSCEQIPLLTKEAMPIESVFVVPRLTPRPVEVTGADKLQVSLNGTWHFNPKPPRKFWKVSEPRGAGWADIEVPGEWVMQGFEVKKDTAAGYMRQFTIPDKWKDRRIKLRCDGVYSDARVWVNGEEAGGHIGGFTPFELDVTDLVRPGQDNTISLTVKNESIADTLASGTSYAGHQLGGITRKIHLFTVPELNIASLHVDTTFDKDYRDAVLRVMLDITNEGNQDIQDAQVQFELTDADGKPVTVEPSTVKLPAIKARQITKQTIEIPVAGVKKWDAEHPNLYILSCQLQTTDKSLETVRNLFGFRQVEVRGRELFVNNKPVKLHGICRHEVHPLRGRSLTPELCRKDALLFRNANMNFIRTSHYPPSEEFLDACDELGIFVEDEAPFCWAFRHEKGKEDKAKYLDVVVRQTLEMIQRDRSHPCIIIWSAANESIWGKNFEKSAEAIRKADASRPRIFSWRQELDIMSHHYPGKDIADELSKFNTPVLFDEYMHLNCYNRSEIVTDPGVREDWGRAFARIWEKMNAAKDCLGGAIWSGVDDIFHLPTGESTGYGPWGPIDGWRRRKPEYWHIKKAYSPIKIPIKTINIPNKGEAIKLVIENRHDFTNLSEIGIKWVLADERGTVNADVPARSSGIITIEPKTTDLEGKKLALKFYSPRGFLIDSYLLPIGSYEETAPKPGITESCETELLKDDNSFTVKGERFSWVFDRKTGQIKSAEIDGQRVLIGGPVLMVLQFGGGRCLPTYRDDTAPLNDTCSQWKADEVTAKQKTDGVEIEVKGRYQEAASTYTMLINRSGQLRISYDFDYAQEPKPGEHMWNDEPDPSRIRQMGVVFDLPKTCDRLSWERKALWTVYPENHIGRANGQAKTFRHRKWPEIKRHTKPPWPWLLDSNALGTNDFRSTKRNIKWASLKDTKGYGILVRSEGRQSTRSYVDGDRIRLLVASHSTGGRDGVSFGHLHDEQKLLEKGTVLEDALLLELVSP